MKDNKVYDEEREVKMLSTVEFKSQGYASFYNTTLEKDKSVLTLSVAGIGFLVTMLQISEKVTFINLSLFFLAAFTFLISIFCIITIFQKNASYITNMVNEQWTETEKQEKVLERLDKIAIYSFISAIILSVALGFSISINKLEFQNMSDKKHEQLTKEMVTIESYNGMADIGKSVSGASQMNPSSSQDTQAQQQAPKQTNTGSGASAMKP
ncbi:hypothetical protein C0J08_21090 [Marinomonas sp. CT5]|uniref:hypothetical protein n=1 Tax=Marinomonas sp. CT5 TaxID=2066133 RepID=UPI001BB0BE30|nr:hypothetical protein [Marinomonas sp. CT5]QUX97751.1 hypothetical protein C0J08_21090 [Marinomonas sp. CT5]